jgi:PAS domain S-box-containing protein
MMIIVSLLNRLSLRFRLLLLILIVTVPTIVVVFLSYLGERDLRLETARSGIRMVLETLKHQQDAMTDNTEQMLAILADMPALKKKDPRTCSVIFEDLIRKYSRYGSIFALSMDGNRFASALPSPPPPNASERKYFKDVVKSGQLSVGEYTVGRTIGKPVLHFSYPVRDDKKRLNAIVVASLMLDHYEKMVSQVKLPEGYILGIADHKGIRLFRHPSNQANLAGSPVPANIWKQMQSDEIDTFQGVGSDGVNRLYMFKKLRLRPSDAPYLYIYVGLEEEVLFATANRELIKDLTTLAMILLIISLLSHILARRVFLKPIDMLLDATKQVSDGNFHVKTGVSYDDAEMGVLARSFDEMTDQIGIEMRERDKAERKFRELFNTVTDAVFVYPFNEQAMPGKIIEANDAACRYSGYSRQELLQMSPLDLDAPESIPVTVEKVKKMMKGGGGVWEGRHITKDQRHVPVEINATIFPLEGRPAILSAVRDISERKQAEKDHNEILDRLKRAEKMEALGNLAGGVAHDMNNVLGVVVGYSELLTVKLPEASPVRGYADKILKSSIKGAAIIQDLLTLARRGVAVSDTININQVVTGFLGTPVFSNLQDYHPLVNFKTDLCKELMNIKGSPIHIEKTVMNLISNAAEAISGEGEVVIMTENRYVDKAIRRYDSILEGEYVLLVITDNGEGIAPADLDKIFEPFYTKKVMGRSGTGLGLAVVWGTVQDHHGYIDVQSELGKGSAFTLYFPASREKRAADLSKIAIEEYKGSGESILVVDDVADQREMAETILRDLGYKVQTVKSGEEAIEYLKRNKADLMVLDMIMEPGIDGLETYRQILQVAPGQKAVIVSGFSETERVKEALELGAGAYVRKPYIAEKIGIAVRKELNS